MTAHEKLNSIGAESREWIFQATPDFHQNASSQERSDPGPSTYAEMETQKTINLIDNLDRWSQSLRYKAESGIQYTSHRCILATGDCLTLWKLTTLALHLRIALATF